jgi:hypothetical protein
LNETARAISLVAICVCLPQTESEFLFRADPDELVSKQTAIVDETTGNIASPLRRSGVPSNNVGEEFSDTDNSNNVNNNNNSDENVVSNESTLNNNNTPTTTPTTTTTTTTTPGQRSARAITRSGATPLLSSSSSSSSLLRSANTFARLTSLLDRVFVGIGESGAVRIEIGLFCFCFCFVWLFGCCFLIVLWVVD